MTPETVAFIRELTGSAHARGIEVLVEVHSYWQRQVAELHVDLRARSLRLRVTGGGQVHEITDPLDLETS